MSGGKFRFALVALLLLAATVRGADNEQRLIEAARTGARDTVRALLKEGAKVNATAADGTTALHWAVRSDDMETVKLLLASGANAKASDRYGITPLTLAAENGSAVGVNALLDAGADPNTAQPNGETVLMVASRTGVPSAIQVLLSRGANPNAHEKEFGETALMWAAAENNAEAIRVLVAGGADKDAQSSALKFPEFKFITSGMVTTALPKGGWSALMYAARQGAIEATKALCDAGVNKDLTDPDGSTAVILAIVNAHFDTAAVLAERGADLNIADSTGMTPVYAAVDMNSLGPMLSRPAPKFVDKLDAPELIAVLMKHGASADTRLKRPIIGRHHDSGDAQMGEGTTPMVRAFKNYDVPVIRALVEGGADATLTQKDYSTTVMLAMTAGAGGRGAGAPPSEATVLELIRLFVDHGVDVDAFNQNGETALHIAAGRGATNIVKLLAERGAKLDMKDKQGRTPLDVASGGGGGAGPARGGARGPAPAPRGGAPGGFGQRGPGGGGGGGNAATAALLRELMTEREASRGRK